MRKLLEVEGLSKAYGTLQALDAVTLTLGEATIHGLVGHNGAGKSTLVKALTGSVSPDAGEIRLQDRAVAFDHPADAAKAGIVPIHQAVSVIPNLSVYRNLLLGLRKQSGERARAVAEEVGLDVGMATLAGALSPPAQRMLMVAQALLREPRVLLLDEPTAVLDQRDTERLFALLRRLRTSGLAILYISHRLEEVLGICDEITVMRQGRIAAQIPEPQHLSSDELASAIVGSPRVLAAEAAREQPRRVPRSSPVAVEVSQLGCGKKLRDVSFALHEGEIVGIAGLVGSGRSTLLRCIAGIEHRSGTVSAQGHGLRGGSVKDALRNGVVFVSERTDEAGIATMSVAENLLLPQLRRHQISPVLPLVSRRRARDAAGSIARELIAGGTANSLDAKLGQLSGGNQRKVAIARWLAAGATVFLLDEPTNGLDIGARESVYELLRMMTSRGASVLLTSAEIEEVVSISDRVLALHDGRIAHTFSGAEQTEEAVSLACFGSGIPTEALSKPLQFAERT